MVSFFQFTLAQVLLWLRMQFRNDLVFNWFKGSSQMVSFFQFTLAQVLLCGCECNLEMILFLAIWTVQLVIINAHIILTIVFTFKALKIFKLMLHLLF